MSIYPVQSQSFQLIGSGAVAGGTTLTLQSFKDILGTNFAMASFGSLGFATIEPNTSNEDSITFTGITQNSDGTATLTGVNSVLFITPFTTGSGFRLSHAGATTLIITNTSAFYNTFGNKNNDEVLTGYWTAPNPLSTQGIATKTYVDNLVNGGTVSVDRVIPVATAGETVAAGNIVYLKAADGRWWKADADLTATIYDVQLGIAQGAGTAGNAITGGVLIEGYDTNQSGLTTGTVYYVSNTAGGISSSAGTNTKVVGNGGQTATKLYFNPNAFAATTLATKTAVLNQSYIYAASSAGTDTYVVTLSPVPTALTVGMKIVVKADVANTGDATLNPNGLGAANILKYYNVTLADNDIKANQIFEVVYDGTAWQMTSPISNTIIVKCGSSTHDISTTGAQTIAHGLGVVPKLVRISGVISTNESNYTGVSSSNGTYNGTTTKCAGTAIETGTVGTTNIGRATTYSTDEVIRLYPFTNGASDSGYATIAVDATNITLTWAKDNSPTGTASFFWEATA